MAFWNIKQHDTGSFMVIGEAQIIGLELEHEVLKVSLGRR